MTSALPTVTLVVCSEQCNAALCGMKPVIKRGLMGRWFIPGRGRRAAKP